MWRDSCQGTSPSSMPTLDTLACMSNTAVYFLVMQRILVACLTLRTFGLLAHVTQPLEGDRRKKKLVWDRRKTNQYSGLLSWPLKSLKKLLPTTKLLTSQIRDILGKKEWGIWDRGSCPKLLGKLGEPPGKEVKFLKGDMWTNGFVI